MTQYLTEFLRLMAVFALLIIALGADFALVLRDRFMSVACPFIQVNGDLFITFTVRVALVQGK